MLKIRNIYWWIKIEIFKEKKNHDVLKLVYLLSIPPKSEATRRESSSECPLCRAKWEVCRPLSPLSAYWKLRQQMPEKEKRLSEWEESFHHRLLNSGGSPRISAYQSYDSPACQLMHVPHCLEITFFPAFLRCGDLLSFHASVTAR